MNRAPIALVGAWITPAEAVGIIGIVTRKTVVKWCRQGILPAQQINGRWYIQQESLLKMLDFHQETQSVTSSSSRKP